MPTPLIMKDDKKINDTDNQLTINFTQNDDYVKKITSGLPDIFLKRVASNSTTNQSKIDGEIEVGNKCRTMTKKDAPVNRSGGSNFVKNKYIKTYIEKQDRTGNVKRLEKEPKWLPKSMK